MKLAVLGSGMAIPHPSRGASGYAEVRAAGYVDELTLATDGLEMAV